MSEPSSLQDFLTWLAQERPIHWTHVQRVIACREPGEPDDLGWIRANAITLADRMPHLAPSSRGAYASRVRTCLKRFGLRVATGVQVQEALVRNERPEPRMVSPALPPPRRQDAAQMPLPALLALQEQLSEALVMVARWPALQADLLPVLARMAGTIAQGSRIPETPPPEEPWEPECPSADCLMCAGEACDLCGAGCWDMSVSNCEHDVLDRHRPQHDANGPITERSGSHDGED